MIADNNIEKHKNGTACNKLVAIALVCAMGISTTASISAAKVEEKVVTNVSTFKNTSNKLNSFKDWVVRKSKEIAMGITGISLSGFIYQTVTKNKVINERDSAEQRARDAQDAQNEAERRARDAQNAQNEAERRARDAQNAQNEAERRARDAQNEAEQRAQNAQNEAEQRARDAQDASQRAEAEKNEAIEKANREKEEAIRVANVERDEAIAAREVAIQEQNRLMENAANDARKNFELEEDLLSVYNGMPILKGASKGFIMNGDLTLNYSQFRFLVGLATGTAYRDGDHTPVWQSRTGLAKVNDARRNYLSRINSYINPGKLDRNRKHKEETIKNLQMTEYIATVFFDQIISPNYQAISTNNYQDIKKM